MQIVSCIKRGWDKQGKASNTMGDVHWWLTAFQNRGCLMEKQRRHHNCFHGRADCDSGGSQIANMQHTRRCTRHRGAPMPVCPSQWGCPVKSLGMSALLCFYTQVERWIWSWCEMCVQGKNTENANTVRDHQATTTDKWRSTQTAWRGKKKKPRPLWNYFYKSVRQITSSSLIPLVWALSYLVLYEPCPSLQASCSSLINIRVFWLL